MPKSAWIFCFCTEFPVHESLVNNVTLQIMYLFLYFYSVIILNIQCQTILEKPQKAELFLNGLKLPALKLWGENVLKMQGSCLLLDIFFFPGES